MSDVEKAGQLFRKARLALPTLPPEAAERLEERREWLFSTREIEISPYNLHHYVDEFESTCVEDYVVLAHSGHGTNSYAIQYYVVQGTPGMFLHLGWGGLSSDARADAARIGECFSLAAQMVAAMRVGESRPAARQTIVASNFYGSHWSSPGESRSQEDENPRPPTKSLAEVLRRMRK